MAAALAPRSASASVSSLLCDTTTRAAIAFAARHAAGGALSASAAALAQEVLRTMLLHKLRLAAMSLLLLAVVATGAAVARSTPSRDPGRASLPASHCPHGGSDGASPSRTPPIRPG